MTTRNGTSPSTSDDDVDIESGVVHDFADPFDITTTKNAPTDSFRQWRQAALVLNALRRFRYTLDLRRNEDREKRRRLFRSHAQVIRVKGLSEMLKTDLDKGVEGDDAEFSNRRDAFGSNTYPVKPGKSILRFIWEA